MSLDFVLFDLDGVLVDSRVPISRCMNHALRALGHAPEPEARLYRWIGPPLDTAFRGILEARGFPDPEADVAGLVDAYRERYATVSLTDTEAMPGVGAALDRLRSRLVLGVATAKPAEFALPILESLGLADRFAAIVGAPLVDSHREPKTRTVERARAAIGYAGGRGAMVGDRAIDVVAGRGNGLHCVTVAWGIGDEDELRAAGPDHHARSPEALADWLLGGAGREPA